MKRMLACLLALLLCATGLSVSAENGSVVYDGNAQEFIFAPGSDKSPTDLFPNFKDVMPGDSITQKITVRNDASKDVKVKIYMRSLGSHPDTVAFLSQMNLTVELEEKTVMFDAAADQTAGLTEWTYLGLLYSGGEVDLNVTLDVPVEMNNAFSQQVGLLDWEFKVEEFPVEDTDPSPPTGNQKDYTWWFVGIGLSLAVLIALLFLTKKKQDDEQ